MPRAKKRRNPVHRQLARLGFIAWLSVAGFVSIMPFLVSVGVETSNHAWYAGSGGGSIGFIIDSTQIPQGDWRVSYAQWSVSAASMFTFQLERHASHQYVEAPPWILLLVPTAAVVGVAHLIRFRLDRSRRTLRKRGRTPCPACGYDITGLERCPECGPARVRVRAWRRRWTAGRMAVCAWAAIVIVASAVPFVIELRVWNATGLGYWGCRHGSVHHVAVPRVSANEVRGEHLNMVAFRPGVSAWAPFSASATEVQPNPRYLRVPVRAAPPWAVLLVPTLVFMALVAFLRDRLWVSWGQLQSLAAGRSLCGRCGEDVTELDACPRCGAIPVWEPRPRPTPS
jgi:hypothetical protein